MRVWPVLLLIELSGSSATEQPRPTTDARTFRQLSSVSASPRSDRTRLSMSVNMVRLLFVQIELARAAGGAAGHRPPAGSVAAAMVGFFFVIRRIQR